VPFNLAGQVIDQGAKETTVPPGKYVLGDPCYTFPSGHWMALLDSCSFFNDSPVGKAAGLEVVAFDTAYGDGCYSDNEGNQYPVDAGLIGLVPVYEGMPTDRLDLGTVVEFTEPTTCSTDGMGRMKFGHYEINTNDPDEGEDDDYELADAEDWDEEEEVEG
jgi:hypothetical protein